MAVPRRASGLWHCIRNAAWVLGALLAASVLPGHAAEAEKNAVLILDANTGKVLYESNADASRHPASLAKMMTLYIVFEQIEQGRLTYETKIKISANATAVQPTKLGLDEGDEIGVLDAIKALITKSANDMAVALAEHIAGSETKFANLMTQKAAQLGMRATRFKNASGLPDDEQVTTARDMVTLALHLQDDFPKHYPLFATRFFNYGGDTYRNHNTLLANYEGTDGLKTGYTNASGFNLVTSVHRGPKHLVGAVFGGTTASQRDRTMRTFLNIGLVKASNVKTRIPAPVLVAARRKPAAETRVAEVPAAQRVERLPAGPARTDEAQAPTKPIEVARVRPVLVTPRTASTAPDSIEAVLERVEPEQAAKQQFVSASAGGSSNNRTQDFTPSDRPAFLSEKMLGVAARPSTLDEQAAQLGGKTFATQSLGDAPERARAPAWEQATVAVAGGFHVQIGAFASIAEAERQLAAVRERAAAVLRNRTSVTLQVKQGDKVLHRARFAGFDAASAASTCSELKRLKVDCLVLKAE